MPKIIENVREQLLAEAKKQISERGYANTTIRSVAGECGLAVGTVYNYFKSKDMLIASFVADDWRVCVSTIEKCPVSDPEAFLLCIYDGLNAFVDKNKALFKDADASKVFATVFSERHKQLRDQMARLIFPMCEHVKAENGEFLSQFIAESMLAWSMSGIEFQAISAILMKIIKN